MDIRALQLLSRFSLPPCSLGYCGQKTAPAQFKKCIILGNCQGVEEEISQFIALYPYLKTIAQITQRPIFSYPVIESYWLGNEQLKKAKPSHCALLLENFLEQGVSIGLIEELRQKPPQVFIPNHLFQVLQVGVGRATGAVPFSLDSINNCMIRWGKVEELVEGKTKVKLHSLKNKSNSYNLTIIQETLPFSPKLTPNLQVGDCVAVHWRQVVKILSTAEEENLIFWTKEVLKSSYSNQQES